MARHETDREDLLREATALLERAELQIAGEPEPVTVGFRRDGSLSVYFGVDPVYQFNSGGELRRAYVGGLLYKAERGSLLELRRERSAHEVALVRRDLTDDEQATLLANARERLDRLAVAFQNGTFEVMGQVPGEADVPRRVRKWLAALPSPIAVAHSPRVS